MNHCTKPACPRQPQDCRRPAGAEGPWGSLLPEKRKNVAGVSFPPGCPIIKKEEDSESSRGKVGVSQGPHRDGEGGGCTEQALG